jgi:hypothetical protein
MHPKIMLHNPIVVEAFIDLKVEEFRKDSRVFKCYRGRKCNENSACAIQKEEWCPLMVCEANKKVRVYKGL